MAAARAKEIYAKEAKKRQGHGKTAPGKSLPVNSPEALKNDARDQAGKAFGVSGFSVDRATRVINEGVPSLVKAVESGQITVSAAAFLCSEIFFQRVQKFRSASRPQNFSLENFYFKKAVRKHLSQIENCADERRVVCTHAGEKVDPPPGGGVVLVVAAGGWRWWGGWLVKRSNSQVVVSRPC